MDQKKIQDALLESRYGEGTDADVNAPDFQASKSEMDALDAMLAFSEDEPPRPGFDTRFFAQLEEMKREAEEAPSWSKKLLWWLAPAGLAAAAALFVFQTGTPVNDMTDDQLAIAMELELFEDFETVRELDTLEDFELIAQLTLDELETEPSEAGQPDEVRFQ